MAKIQKEIWIEAPLEEIFDYVSNPYNITEFWPSVIEVKDVKSLPNGGHSVRWVYKMLGLRLEGKAEFTKIVTNEFFVVETRGGVMSTIAFTFRSLEDKVRVTGMVEYKVPVPLLGKLAETIIVKMNENEADLVMANILAKFSQSNTSTPER